MAFTHSTGKACANTGPDGHRLRLRLRHLPAPVCVCGRTTSSVVPPRTAQVRMWAVPVGVHVRVRFFLCGMACLSTLCSTKDKDYQFSGLVLQLIGHTITSVV